MNSSLPAEEESCRGEGLLLLRIGADKETNDCLASLPSSIVSNGASSKTQQLQRLQLINRNGGGSKGRDGAAVSVQNRGKLDCWQRGTADVTSSFDNSSNSKCRQNRGRQTRKSWWCSLCSNENDQLQWRPEGGEMRLSWAQILLAETGVTTARFQLL